ncbi:hypothetical protein TSOC_008786 [Tetrabaena socialis]|uniref:Uncharacterized protein n=1 Tax=Tetrabaena socialis TaxID=47790 RepID=A0A2J7ZXI8_9CHLO|nr:hypothetical protein TSOC_008786 [Tetrabaena socialis]|eukprot:PNH04983.1 hypothetical protein TSOC_008786 [Tetrabaena socialis]
MPLAAHVRRQRIRDKYGLQAAGSCTEVVAGCCYPCTLYDTHIFLRERQYKDIISGASRGPLVEGLEANRRGAVATPSQGGAKGKQSGAATRVDGDAYTEVSLSPVRARKPALTADNAAGAQRASLSFSAAAVPTTEASDTVVDDSTGCTPGRMVTLFGRERMPSMRQAQHPSQSASTEESRGTAASSSIPPPEVTDSPRLAAATASASFAASSASCNGTADNTADSASFPIPAALPLPSMVRDPPVFSVPAALKPPDSADSEVVAAWMQGPKLSHLSMSLQQPVPASTPKLAATVTDSGASLFSITLDANSPRRSAGAARAAVTSAASTCGSTAAPTTGLLHSSSRDGNGTMTSSKLSAIINRELLNGSGASAGHSSAGALGNSLQPSESFRHSTVATMATIAEADIDVNPRPSAHSKASTAANPAAVKPHPAAAASSAMRPPVAAPRNAQRNSRQSGKGGAGSWLGALGGVSTSVARPGNSSNQHAGARSLRASEVTAAAPPAAASASRPYDAEAVSTRRRPDGGHGVDDGASGDALGASGDNFSSFAPSNRGTATPPPAPHPPAYPGNMTFPASPYGDGDTMNLASVRPSFADGPDMQAFKQMLRLAGEAADAAPAMATPPAVQLASSQPVHANQPSGLARLAAPAASSGRYGRPAAANAQDYLSLDIAGAAAYASGADDHRGDGASSASVSSGAMDGPVSSGEAHSGPAAQAESVGQSNLTELEGDGAVSVSRGSAQGGGDSLSKHSASGLSIGDTNAAYSSMGDSRVSASQHHRAHYINWMAQSVISDADAASSRVVRQGSGRPVPSPAARGAKWRAAPAASCNSVNQGAMLPSALELDDGCSSACADSAGVSGRWE